MKRTLFIITFSITTLVNSTLLFSQVANCDNLGFELGNFTNWEGTTWNYSVENPQMTTAPIDGILDRRQTIITDQEAFDPTTGNLLKLIPPGYRYSCRLGDVITDQDEFFTRCWHQNLRYTMDIDANNALLILKYALVLEYADDHIEVEEPRFRFTIYDQQGDTLPGCANYDVYASNENIEGFNYIESTGFGSQVMWRDWTTVGFDLTEYLGQTITIEFLTSDCTQTHHFGYGYFVASCQPLNINLKNCAEDSVATLTAPEGFEIYDWVNESDEHVGDKQQLNVSHPISGDVFSCNMTSETGCEVSLSTTILKYNPVARFDSYMLDCFSNTVQLTNQSTTNTGVLSYLWDFGDGNTSRLREPEYTFLTSGMHDVRLSIFNLPSICDSELFKQVESFSPPLVFIDGDSIYCKNDSITLYANGAYDYTWSDSSKGDSILIGDPGGPYWLLGRSSTGCVSDTMRRRVQEEDEWSLINIGDTVLCEGDSTILIASGAVSYVWNTEETSDTIVIKTPGIYSNIGTSALNCSKSFEIAISEKPIPYNDFNLSTNLLESRESSVTGTIIPQDGVTYFWDMDDGNTLTGSNIKHTYNISGSKLYYDVSMTATSMYGCKNSSYDIIDVIPFTPNVFSPNGDGVNDLFMEDFNLQVFDRQGIELYTGEEGWDGTYNGRDASPDTYFYSIFYSNREGKEHHLKGYITLVR